MDKLVVKGMDGAVREPTAMKGLCGIDSQNERKCHRLAVERVPWARQTRSYIAQPLLVRVLQHFREAELRPTIAGRRLSECCLCSTVIVESKHDIELNVARLMSL